MNYRGSAPDDLPVEIMRATDQSILDREIIKFKVAMGQRLSRMLVQNLQFQLSPNEDRLSIMLAGEAPVTTQNAMRPAARPRSPVTQVLLL
ncbi:MAG: hypothetical protein WCP28_07515 [Actinomycetes bacterium]